MIKGILNEGMPTKIMNDQAAGTGDTLNSSIVNLSGKYRAICGIIALGDVTDTAVLTLKAYVGNVSNLSDGAYLSTTATVTAGATDADDHLLVLDIPDVGPYQYVRFDLIRATANAVVDAGIAIQYNPRTVPTTAGADIADAETHS